MIDVSVLENEFHAAQEAVQHQGDVVRALKARAKDGEVERVSLTALLLHKLRRGAASPHAAPPTHELIVGPCQICPARRAAAAGPPSLRDVQREGPPPQPPPTTAAAAPGPLPCAAAALLAVAHA